MRTRLKKKEEISKYDGGFISKTTYVLIDKIQGAQRLQNGVVTI